MSRKTVRCTMEISFSENEFANILDLHSNELSFDVLSQLKKIINSMQDNKPIAIDFKNINFICREFLDFIKDLSSKKNISIININPELFAILDLTEYCKFVQIFASKSDFIKNKRSIINRKFSIIRNS